MHESRRKRDKHDDGEDDFAQHRSFSRQLLQREFSIVDSADANRTEPAGKESLLAVWNGGRDFVHGENPWRATEEEDAEREEDELPWNETEFSELGPAVARVN